MWGLRSWKIWFYERGVIPSQCPGGFLCDLFLGGSIFTQKNNSTSHSLISTTIYTPPPKSQCEFTCCHNYKVDEWEEVKQEEDWCGDPWYWKFWRDGGEDKGGKKQEYEERFGEMSPGYDREE